MRDDLILSPDDYSALTLLLQERGRRKWKARTMLVPNDMNTLVEYSGAALKSKLEGDQSRATAHGFSPLRG